jgi:hypothetical protein
MKKINSSKKVFNVGTINSVINDPDFDNENFNTLETAFLSHDNFEVEQLEQDFIMMAGMSPKDARRSANNVIKYDRF